MLRLSVTQVGSYVQYLNGRISLRQLVEGLTQITQPNIKMKVGSIFHCLLQDMDHPEKDIVTFNEQDIIDAKQKIDKRSNIYEYKIRKKIKTNRGEVLLTGVADQIVGNVVHEYKTTFSPFSYDRYADSVQWMGYCYLFDVDKVIYQVWQLTEPDETEDLEKRKEIQVKSYNEFSLFGSISFEHQFKSYLNGLVDLISMLDLEKAIENKQNQKLA